MNFYIADMPLYHGSNSSIEKPLLLKASHPTDFGISFQGGKFLIVRGVIFAAKK